MKTFLLLALMTVAASPANAGFDRTICSNDAFEKIKKSPTPVFIKFGFKGCGPCLSLQKDLEKLSAKHPEWPIYDIDVRKCGIPLPRSNGGFPQFAAYANGKELMKQKGYDGDDSDLEDSMKDIWKKVKKGHYGEDCSVPLGSKIDQTWKVKTALSVPPKKYAVSLTSGIPFCKQVMKHATPAPQIVRKSTEVRAGAVKEIKTPFTRTVFTGCPDEKANLTEAQLKITIAHYADVFGSELLALKDGKLGRNCRHSGAKAFEIQFEVPKDFIRIDVESSDEELYYIACQGVKTYADLKKVLGDSYRGIECPQGFFEEALLKDPKVNGRDRSLKHYDTEDEGSASKDKSTAGQL